MKGSLGITILFCFFPVINSLKPKRRFGNCVEKLNRLTTTKGPKNIFAGSFRQDYVIDK